MTYFDHDDNVIYGFYGNETEPEVKVYHGDYKATLNRNGLVDVFEFYEPHSLIKDEFYYVA